MVRRTILSLAVAAVVFGTAARAQENATLTLRSGERVTVQLLDMGGVGFNVRVNGQEQQVPINDVAAIDFSGGPARSGEWAKVAGGSQVIWLRNGETVNGTLYDIAGTSPLRIIFRTSSGDREYSSAEIGRILLAHTDAAAAAVGTTGVTADLAQAARSGIGVSARSAWTPAGLSVRRGEVLAFKTTGEIQLSPDTKDVAGPTGARSERYAATAPLPRAFAGALIGRVGNGAPFPIGSQTTLTMPATGQLFLGINDVGFDDNAGEFRVEIRRGRQ